MIIPVTGVGVGVTLGDGVGESLGVGVTVGDTIGSGVGVAGGAGGKWYSIIKISWRLLRFFGTSVGAGVEAGVGVSVGVTVTVIFAASVPFTVAVPFMVEVTSGVAAGVADPVKPGLGTAEASAPDRAAPAAPELLLPCAGP